MTTTAKAPVHHKRENYFSDVMGNTRLFITDARRALADVDFDTFVVRGMSGAIAGGVLAHSMKKNLFVVRKDDDDSHDGNRPFGMMGDRWLFLDDFISSGATFWKVYHSITERCIDPRDHALFGEFRFNEKKGIFGFVPSSDLPTFAGSYLYRRDGFQQPDQHNQYIANGRAGYFDHS